MKFSLAIGILLATSVFLQADGGAPIGQFEKEGLRVTVFAAPAPIRAGVLDVSALVQESASGLPATDASVSFSLQKLSPPSADRVRMPAWCSTTGSDGRIPATSAHSSNKLLCGAFLPVPESGLWEVTAHVICGPTKLALTIPFPAGPPPSPLATWWPMIALVPCAIGLYSWREILLNRRRMSCRNHKSEKEIPCLPKN